LEAGGLVVRAGKGPTIGVARLLVIAGRVILPGDTFCGVGRAGLIFTAGGLAADFCSASLRRSSSPRLGVRDFSGRAVVVGEGKGPTIGVVRLLVIAGRVILPGEPFCGVGRVGLVFTAGGLVADFCSASLRRSSSPRLGVRDC